MARPGLRAGLLVAFKAQERALLQEIAEIELTPPSTPSAKWNTSRVMRTKR